MSGSRTATLAFATLVASCSIATASASAVPIEFVYKTSEGKLEAGHTDPFSSKAKTSFVLKGQILGVTLELTATAVKTDAAAALIGGKPGTSAETMTFTGVTVNKPSSCVVPGASIVTNALKNELVEGAIAKAGTGKVLPLFVPASGTILTEFSLGNNGTATCALKGTGYKVTGAVLAGNPGQKVLKVIQELEFEASTKEYRNDAGTFATAGLVLGGNAATLTGILEIELVSKLAFGLY